MRQNALICKTKAPLILNLESLNNENISPLVMCNKSVLAPCVYRFNLRILKWD